MNLVACILTGIVRVMLENLNPIGNIFRTTAKYYHYNLILYNVAYEVMSVLLVNCYNFSFTCLQIKVCIFCAIFYLTVECIFLHFFLRRAYISFQTPAGLRENQKKRGKMERLEKKTKKHAHTSGEHRRLIRRSEH